MRWCEEDREEPFVCFICKQPVLEWMTLYIDQPPDPDGVSGKNQKPKAVTPVKPAAEPARLEDVAAAAESNRSVLRVAMGGGSVVAAGAFAPTARTTSNFADEGVPFRVAMGGGSVATSNFAEWADRTTSNFADEGVPLAHQTDAAHRGGHGTSSSSSDDTDSRRAKRHRKKHKDRPRKKNRKKQSVAVATTVSYTLTYDTHGKEYVTPLSDSDESCGDDT